MTPLTAPTIKKFEFHKSKMADGRHFENRRWVIKRKNPSTGLTSRGVNYIAAISPEDPRGRICTKFGKAVVAAFITCDKFFGDRLRGVHSVGVEFCHSPLTSQVPLTQVWPVIIILINNKQFLWERFVVYSGLLEMPNYYHANAAQKCISCNNSMIWCKSLATVC